MRVLFITPYLPSLIRVRPFNLIRTLALRGHQITLLALRPPSEDSGGFADLQGWCQSVHVVELPRWRPLWNGLRTLPTSVPFQASYSRSPQMNQLIDRRLSDDDFDVIHLEHLRGAELGRGFNIHHSPPIVFDAVDSISLLFERAAQGAPRWKSRLLARIDLNRTRDYEGKFLQRFSRVLVTSPDDRDALAKLSQLNGGDTGTNKRLVVLPNGVDLNYFKPLQERRQPNTVIFSGKMSYHANTAAALDLVQSIMPAVWVERPQTQVWLVGKDPPAVVRELAKDPRVKVTGTVPDIRPHLGRATLSVSPLRYSVGIQNKVLEAMAMGTPVITTSGACRALMVEPDTHLLVGDTIPSLAQAILWLLGDADKRHRLGRAGRTFVENHHDWDSIAALLEAVYQESIDEPIFRKDAD